MKGINLSEWALKNQPLVRYLMIMLMVLGSFAYTQLGQKEDPEFTFKAMVVQLRWPGASVQEMEKQVTDQVEEKLQDLATLDKVDSFTKPGETQMILALREDTPAKDVAQQWYLVRKKLADLQRQLPNGVQGPFFNDEFGDTFGNLYAFTGDGFSYEDLRRYAQDAKREALRLPDVGKVELVGEQEENIYVNLDSAKLANLQLDARTIWNALSAQNNLAPAGAFNTASDRILVRPQGAYKSVQDIGNTPITAAGRSFKLSDISTVERRFVDPASFRMRFNGMPALGLAVSMRSGGDVLQLGKGLSGLVQKVQANLPVGVEIHAVSDQPKVVAHSVNEFMHSLIEAVIIVLAVSFFSLGMRTGVVVALSIPLVLALTFLAMWVFKLDLQRISLGSLIIALGLLVDDAIIAAEMMALKLEQGWSRFQAATYAYKSTAFPMLTGTLITAATFMPVGLAKSDAGEYVFSLFAVVGIALMLSWIVAVVFTPYLGFILLKEHKHEQHDENAVYQKPFYQRFARLLTWCLDYRKTVIAITIGVFILSLGMFKLFVAQQFFPSSNRPELMVDLWLPQGASFAATERAVKKLETKLKTVPHVDSVTSYVGGGSPRFYLPLDQQMQHLNYAQLMVMTESEQTRDSVKTAMEKMFETDFPQLRGRVTRLENGPPVGYPVQFRVLGQDHDKVRAIAAKVEDIMRSHPAARHVNNNWGEQLKSLKVEIDQDKARALGVSNQNLSQQLQMLISGSTVTGYREGDRTLAVVARLNSGERRDVAQLGSLMIQNDSGRYIALSQLGKISYAPEESIIWRRNRLPSLSVRADVADGVQAADVAMALQPKIAALDATLPLGYHIELGGDLESSTKAQTAIGAVAPLMLVTVLTLLMLQLKSFQRTLMVVLTAPLGLIGVTWALMVFRVPFGFVAMLGVIALAGMIMRNSVILVAQIDDDIADGVAPFQAVLGATVRRFRPIMLTALAAILAMIPLTRSTFWGPMAVAIMGGLLVATVLTLLFLPALYAQWFGVKRPQSAPAEQEPRLVEAPQT